MILANSGRKLIRCLAVLAAGILRLRADEQQSPPMADWGVDACLTVHVANEARPAYLQLLRGSGVSWLREREPKPEMAELKAAGFRVISFFADPQAEKPRPGDVLPDDLLSVSAHAKALAKSNDARFVDAWEMLPEEDVGYCRDLPDRAVAYQKAVYLGLKAGAAESGRAAPIVLMGALALPPGPWLDRATRNGLLNYTDAYNFHFYGLADDFAGVIAAHRAFLAKSRATSQVSGFKSQNSSLPLWVTECGFNVVNPADPANADRRRLQAEFTMATARQALKAKDLAVFLPFILVHQDDPHALTLAADRPLPAWDAYAKYTRQHAFPARLLTQPPPPPNPVVVQWLVDNNTCIPHKVSGAYRFWQGRPMRGEVRVYNFGETPVRGRLLTRVPAAVDLTGLEPEGKNQLGSPEVEIGAHSAVTFPVTFAPGSPGYFREDCEMAFVETSGVRSPVSFGLERWPESRDFVEQPLRSSLPARGRTEYPLWPEYRREENLETWTTTNGLRVKKPAAPATDGSLVFWVNQVDRDPMFPPQAATRIAGLPEEGFIKLELSRPMDNATMVRLDLVDDRGQRFTIWENFGRSYFVSSPEVWLNLADFNGMFWGRCTDDPQFHPARIRELQLRFYFARAGDPIEARVSLMKAK